MHELRFRTDDAIDLVAHAWGKPGDRAVIFLHGGGQTRHAWKNTAQQIAQHGYHAIAVDLRGHGDSGWSPGGNYTMERFTADLRCIAATLEQRPIVIGASLGGITALMAEGEGPPFLDALVLVDIAPTVQRAGVAKINQFMGAHAVDGFASVEQAAETVAAYLPHRPRPTSLAGLAKNLRLHADGRYRWHWDPALMSFAENLTPAVGERLLTAAGRLALPVLLVRGGASEIVSEADAKKFLELVPGSRYIDIADARHMVAGDVNDHFGSAILGFLADLH